jgi:hypothetical protein
VYYCHTLDGTRWPGLVVPDTKTTRIMQADKWGEISWHVILLGANHLHHWVPDTRLASFDGGSVGHGPVFGRALRLAQTLAPLTLQERVGELIRLNRLKEKNRVVPHQVGVCHIFTSTPIGVGRAGKNLDFRYHLRESQIILC